MARSATARDGAPREQVAELAGRVQPLTLAAEQLLPVAAPLRPLLPDGGLRRGSTLIAGESLSLALALVAEASAADSWVAAVGLPQLGIVAAAEHGVCLERFALVPAVPPARWAVVVAALLDSLDVVLAVPPSALGSAQARRLATRARDRRTLLLLAAGAWPGPADLELAVSAIGWYGPDHGAGYLQARLVEVAIRGRGAASRPRRARLWLPDPRGRLASVDPPQDRLLPARVGG